MLVVIFAVVSTALLAYGGPRFLAANTGDVLNAVGGSVLGGTAVKILILSVLTSAAASTQPRSCQPPASPCRWVPTARCRSDSPG